MDALRRGARLAVVCAALVLLVPVALAGGLGVAALMGAVGAAAILLGLLPRGGQGIGGQGIGGRGGRERPGPWFAALLAFALWAAASTLWSYHPQPGGWALLASPPALLLFGVVVYTAAAGGILHSARRSPLPLAHLALAATSLLIGLSLADLLTGHGLSQLMDPPGDVLEVRLSDARKNVGRGVVIALLLLPGAVFAAWDFANHGANHGASHGANHRENHGAGRGAGRGWRGAAAGGALVLGTVAAAWLVGQAVVIPAAVAAGIAGAFAWRFPRIGVVAAFAGGALSLAFAPVAGRLAGLLGEGGLGAIGFSAEHRLRMWAYVAEKIGESPLWGHGFGASRTLDATMDIRGYDMALVSLHPHNMGLQIWLETGAVGVALALLALGSAAALALEWVEGAGGERRRAAAVAALVAVVSVVGAVSFGAWQEWWWASVFLAVALLPVALREA